MKLLKKAVVEIGLLEWIGIILALVLIAGTAYFFASMTGLWGPGQKEQGTISNFAGLASTVNAMIDLPGECAFTTEYSYYIDSSHILVGFNKDRGFVEDACQQETVLKPQVSACRDSACLCLYSDPGGTDDDFVDNPPITCEALKGKTGLAADYVFTRKYYSGTSEWFTSSSSVMFSAPENVYKNIIGMPWGPPPEYYMLFLPNMFYSHFFLYGECGDWGSNEVFGSAPLYVEVLKVPEAGKVAVFIAYSTEQLIKGRRGFHSANNVVCTEYF